MSLRRSVWSVLRWSGMTFLVRAILQRRKVTILFYHDIDPSALSRHLAILGKQYHFIRLRDYLDARLSGTMDTLPRHALVVTLDDGLRGNFELREVFQQHSVIPTLFITSGIVGTNRRFWTMLPIDRAEVERLKTVPDSERVAELAALGHGETDSFPERCALSRQEIEEMKSWADIQSHTVLHPILSMCSDERAWTEIAQSKADLENEYGLSIYALAYPNGTTADYSDREIAFAARAGYECAVTTAPGFNDAGADPLQLKRNLIPDGASNDEVLVKACLLPYLLKKLMPFGRGSAG